MKALLIIIGLSFLFTFGLVLCFDFMLEDLRIAIKNKFKRLLGIGMK